MGVAEKSRGSGFLHTKDKREEKKGGQVNGGCGGLELSVLGRGGCSPYKDSPGSGVLQEESAVRVNGSPP